jgi:putative transposase
MTSDSRSHHHRSIRARCYDYSQPGTYFVTICADGMKCWFGNTENGAVHLNSVGQVVEECWCAIPKHFPTVELDAFVVMPNHMHGIVGIPWRGTAYRAPTEAEFGKPVANSLSTVIRSFKSATTKRLRETTGNSGLVVWQRNYFEHVVRNDDALERIREYIVSNPWNWAADSENPDRTGEDKFDAWLRSFRRPPRRCTASRAPTAP